MIYKVSDSTSFLCSYDHLEQSSSYLAIYWRSGQNSMNSQVLNDRNTKLKIHVLLQCKDFHSSIHSSLDRTLPLFFTESLLTVPKKQNLLPPLRLSCYLPCFTHPILPILYLFSLLCSVLPHVPVTRSGFLYKPISFQISLPPHPPPSLINVASHQLHQSRRHLPAIPSQTARRLLPHASHAQSELAPPLKKKRSAALINEAAGLVLIRHSGIHTQCTVIGQIRAVTPCSVTVPLPFLAAQFWSNVFL